MPKSTLRRPRVSLTVRRAPAVLSGALAGLFARAASADWGENWGAMSWGAGATPVPGLDAWGLLLLSAAFLLASLWLIARGRGPRVLLVLLVALALPLTAYAATITMPNVFVNGTTADADEVNANFDTIVLESNDQHLRITALEGSVVHTHPGGDITSQVADADTVDGAHAADLEESAEIDADVAAHAALESAHHARYQDPEALAAMGTKANANPLHHDRYTDTEALFAAAGVDAGTLDGFDSTDFAMATHAHSYGKVAIVAESGGDYTDPKAAMDALATWCGAPSAANRCLLRIMAGVFDLGANALVMQPYVDVEGSGENATLVTSTNSSGAFGVTSSTVVGASNAEIRFLTAENRGGSTLAIGILNDAAATKLTHVTARAFGASFNLGVTNIAGATATLTNVTASATGAGTFNHGVSNDGASPTMTNVRASASGATTNYGVQNFDGSSPVMKGGSAAASGGTTSRGVYNLTNALPTLTNVTATATGASGSNYALENDASSPVLQGVSLNGIMATGNTLFVPAAGTESENGVLLLAVADEITGLGTPSAANRYVVQLDAGTYDLGNAGYYMQEWVDLAGRGRSVSTITSVHYTSGAVEDRSTLIAADDSEVRSLSVSMTSSYPIGIAIVSASPRIQDVAVTVSGVGATEAIAIQVEAAAEPVLTNVDVSAAGGFGSTGIVIDASSPALYGVRSTGRRGIDVMGGSLPFMSDVVVTTTTPGYGVRRTSADTVLGEFYSNGIRIMGDRIFVPATGSPTENGLLLRTADDVIEGLEAPSSTNLYVIELDAGIYDLGNAGYYMLNWASVVGQGQESTKITSTHSGSGYSDAMTVMGADHAELRSLTVENHGGSANSYGVVVAAGWGKAIIKDVAVRAEGGSALNVGVLIGDEDVVMRDVTVEAIGAAANCYAIQIALNRELLADSVEATASGASGGNFAIFGDMNSDVAATNSKFDGAIQVQGGSSVLTFVTTMLSNVPVGGSHKCVGAYDSLFTARDATCN